MIDRKELVRRHNPVLTRINKESPLTVGNGRFAFTADITGFQTLYNEYEPVPLCTMSEWGWHTKPDGDKYYNPSDVEMTRYNHCGREVTYASEMQEGNETIYNWLRQNPHRLNLVKIALLWDGKEICGDDLTEVRQELDLYSGLLSSQFKIFGNCVSVLTVCADDTDTLGFSISSSAYDKISVSLSFPYGSHKITASDWDNSDNHGVSGTRPIMHRLDSDTYYIYPNGDADFVKTNTFEYRSGLKQEASEFTLSFSKADSFAVGKYSDVVADSSEKWRQFWESGGAVDFSKSRDRRAAELERRAVLSQYQLAVNSCGTMPPAETGLVCNSWYGKFHLEMHILHSGWLPLWGKEKLLERSLEWYRKILPNAEANAARNGNLGARWVKMTGPEGIDSPSRIAVLLIWQQPHILYMLDLIKRNKTGDDREEFMRKYWDIVCKTADFMADFAVLDEKTGAFCLMPPIIPAQEEHDPVDVKNPAFELCYWKYGLKIAADWASELELSDENSKNWRHVGENMATPAVHNGLYSAHENCPDTFEKYSRDHPSMLFGYGFLDGTDLDKDIVGRTIDKVLNCWDFKTCWGWDFALMAMTLAKLGRREEAIDVLLMDTEKNAYVESGNNFQRGRTDLPLYLPGNGSLLFALAFILNLGFPENGLWDLEYENINV